MKEIQLTVIIGHRGTGKTSFLHRWAEYQPEAGPFYDLDFEIEKSQGLSVSNIFASKGESAFRDLESQLFKKLSTASAVIALGAGFHIKNIPTSARVIWVRRQSDGRGRIFTDRPRLILETDPLSEYETKRKDRDPIFSERADLIHTVPEGIEFSFSVKAWEKNILLSALQESSLKAGGIKTLFPKDLQRAFFASPQAYEFRDDLLSEEQMQQFLAHQRHINEVTEVLYSFRTQNSANEKMLKDCAWVDLPVEKCLETIKVKKLIGSFHDEDIYEGIKALSEKSGMHLKLSPLVLTWKELSCGHEWQQEDPKNRSFLPRSPEGRWKWYRLFQKGRQELNFWYESQSSASDQPSLLEWLIQSEKVSVFGAVLGSPVHHSLSPMMHFDFFQRRQAAIFAIDVKAEEWSQALPILQAWGLKAAAITSPLKKLAYQACEQRSELAQDLRSVNTLLWSDISKSWKGTNTDFPGFLQSLEGKALPSPFVIWGGEGVLPVIKKALPGASAYSARAGKPKPGEVVMAPSTLIWAAPSREGVQFPPPDWSPRVVVDLNYTENSWARQYAVQIKARYQSGLEFFRLQALEQQKFWESGL